MTAASWNVAGDAAGEPTDATCAHLAHAAAQARPRAHECPDCIREGSTWVHLRQCLVCGHVGCCDSSPRRHATAHWREQGHAVVRSIEPGEDWGWCYPDELMLLPATDG